MLPLVVPIFQLKIANFSTYNFSATNEPMAVHQHSFTDLQEVTDNLLSTFKILFLRSLSVTNVTQYKGYRDSGITFWISNPHKGQSKQLIQVTSLIHRYARLYTEVQCSHSEHLLKIQLTTSCQFLFSYHVA